MVVRDGFMPFFGCQIKEVFEQLKHVVNPDVIFTHNGNDGHQDHRLIIAFEDGSTMTVKTAGTTASAATGGTIAKVRQQGTELALDFEDSSPLLIPLAEATSSVMVRAHDHTLEYAD